VRTKYWCVEIISAGERYPTTKAVMAKIPAHAKVDKASLNDFYLVSSPSVTNFPLSSFFF